MLIPITILIILLFVAFFSGMETAFISANKLQIELDKKQSVFPSRILTIFSANSSHYITTMLIGSNLALVIYCLMLTKLVEPLLLLITPEHSLVLLMQIVFCALLLLALGELIFKTFFRVNPNNALRIFALPAYFFYLVFYPIARFLKGLSRGLLRVFGVKSQNEPISSFGAIDFEHFSNDTPREVLEHPELKRDVKILQNALDFSTIKLRECVVPRTEIEAVSIDDSVDLLKQKFIETGYSKILIYQDSIDNIIGFAHSIDLFEKPENIKSMVRKIPIVPETMPANKLLGLFIQNRKSMAVVVDEFGGTSGIVTVEDILEEIVGDIQDEHDTIDLEETQLTHTEFRFSGRLEIDNLNTKYHINLPASDDYETIAGLILKHHGSIPKVNDLITIEKFSFKILKATHTKIELIHLKIIN